MTEGNSSILEEIGEKKVECENQLLSLMLRGHNTIELTQSSHQFTEFFNQQCDLQKYVTASRLITLPCSCENPQYKELSIKEQFFYNTMLALDGLVIRKLVEREIMFVGDVFPETGYRNLENKLDGTDGQYLTWLARALYTDDQKLRAFEYPEYQRAEHEQPESFRLEKITYTLSTKGYDVALKLQQHEDQVKFSTLQTEVSRKQVSISNQQIRVSSRALSVSIVAVIAASFIAIGSIGNLYLSYRGQQQSSQLSAKLVKISPLVPVPLKATDTSTQRSLSATKLD